MVNDLLQASDSGHVSILSLLDLSAAFDTIDRDILIKRLHTTFDCSGMVLDWLTSYLSFCTQSVFVGHASTPSALKCGVLQGSFLGPLLFTFYTQSLSTVINFCQSGHSYHFFADDSQLHNSSTPSDFPALAHSLKDCIEDVAEWMCDSMLKMNHEKTELIAIGTKPKISQVTLSLTPVSISGHNIPFSQSVRNLGVVIDETLSMDVHIKHLCRILFCQLRRLGKIRPFLSADTANKLAVSFVLTRLDYCNSLLAGLPDNKLNKLQHIQNHAAQIVLRKPRHMSATSLLRTLHWLPVKVRIQYKIACCCFQCLPHNTIPPYLLTFFILTNHLERCTLLTPLWFQFLTSVWRPLAEIFLCFWPHCLEFLTFISQKNSMFFNFQKEAKNSSVRKASQLMFASVFFCVCLSVGGVCVICYLWIFIWQPAWCIWYYAMIFSPIMCMYISCVDLCVHHESDAELICMCFFFRHFNILCYASVFYLLLFVHQMFMMHARACVCVLLIEHV